MRTRLERATRWLAVLSIVPAGYAVFLVVYVALGVSVAGWPDKEAGYPGFYFLYHPATLVCAAALIAQPVCLWLAAGGRRLFVLASLAVVTCFPLWLVYAAFRDPRTCLQPGLSGLIVSVLVCLMVMGVLVAQLPRTANTKLNSTISGAPDIES